MSDAIEPLILDLLEFVGAGSRPYQEVMDAWRTSCPRLPIWEEATARGLLVRQRDADGAVVAVTPAGQELLKASRSNRG